ncbi:hypothetical protein K378_03786 [Streptomyces sp. Amel2xB2]|uniref:hypothetical protein n=1 Tax=Streptomyces sp. Amel2xB2 TaxID=1305829 RepID=UPI000DBF5B6D|nr:hypothetical protein [Streptomyces sp. Amel2xB2]RAJ62435.1 hypothetical protein K378_03786 [Streptomyces sp. Amel2xB2]
MSAVRWLLPDGTGAEHGSYAVLTESAPAGGFAERGPGAARCVRVVLTGSAGERVVDEHLRAGLHAPPHGRGLADVLVGCDGGDDGNGGNGRGPGADGGCARCAGPEPARRHPGALVVAVPQGEGCVLRYGAASPYASGTRGRLALGPAQRACAPWESWASLAHAWLVAGRPMADFGRLPEAGHRQCR